jgi:hypothetical protein
MNKRNDLFRLVGLFLLLGFAAEKSAQAYVDPGSGAMFYQILLAGVIGGIFRLRRVTSWFRSRKKSDDSVVQS